MLSGEAVTSIAVEEICDVRGLKRRLHQLHGLPPRFRQRVLAHAQDLEDSVPLDSPMDLDLVLLSFADVSESQGDNLVDAARRGFMVEEPRSEDNLGTLGIVHRPLPKKSLNPEPQTPKPLNPINPTP